jgi:hypothetical protein
MSYKPRYDNGSWTVICDQCGRQFKANELQLRWDGLMVCKGDWEPRQPQDYVHGVADKIAPPWTRAEQSDDFIFFCTVYSSQAVVGYATAGCAKAGIDNNYRITE